MTVTSYSWYVGHNEDKYHTKCESHAEAVAIAKQQDGGYICYAGKPDSIQLSDYFYAEDFLNSAEDGAYDVHGDHDSWEPIFDISEVEKDDLQNRVRATIENWQHKNKLKFAGFAFSSMKYVEYIPPNGGTAHFGYLPGTRTIQDWVKLDLVKVGDLLTAVSNGKGKTYTVIRKDGHLHVTNDENPDTKNFGRSYRRTITKYRRHARGPWAHFNDNVTEEDEPYDGDQSGKV